ncbi:MAG: hypothetical protein K2X81_29330, partial [Candidatus Obscuribacterales bacterium]|nr:hypothetical protein [Candidatus Obscuribacterales bacterium]
NISELSKVNGGFAAVADVSIDLGGGAMVSDRIIGYGTAAQEACISAIDQFVGSMVAPIAALSMDVDLQKWRCRVTNFDIPASRGSIGWNMIVGQIVSNDQSGKLYALADNNPPIFDVITPIVQHICDRSDENPHWAKIYLYRYPGGLDGEVRIDNEVSEEAFEILRNYIWPTKQELIWFRQFSILEPADETERRKFGAAKVRRNHAPEAQPKPANFLSKFLKGNR